MEEWGLIQPSTLPQEDVPQDELLDNMKRSRKYPRVRLQKEFGYFCDGVVFEVSDEYIH